MSLRIVHISDLHLSQSNYSAFKNFYLSAVLKDLKLLNAQKKIDIICLTGDILDKGGSSFKISDNRYLYFIEEFWQPIAKALELSDDRLFIVPGNHDIDESLIDEFVENGLASTLQTVEKINEFVEKGRLTDYFGSIRQREYKEFEKVFYKGIGTGYVSSFESCHVLTVNNIRVGIACLNSSWRCYTKQKPNFLVMGSTQISQAASYLKEKNCNIVIGLMHHPVDFLSDIEKQEVSTRLRTSGFDVILFGHTHAGETIYQTGNNGSLFISTARTGFSNPRDIFEKYQSGYTIVDIKDLDITCKFRKYINSRNSFDSDTDLAEGGEFSSKLIPKEGQQAYYKLLSLSDSVESAKIDNINNSLVIAGTDTIAPRSVNDIFVLPRLTNSAAGYESFEAPEYLSLNDIIISNENCLIFGDKESGKTTLLNKISVELFDSFSFYEKIPVKIDFSDIKKNQIRYLIKEYISSVSNSELDNLLEEGKLVLLVDNVSIEDEDEKQSSYKLQDFLTKWSNVKCIAATSSHSNLFMEDDGNCLAGFKNIHINPVGAKEFKSLATKWFCNRNQEWIKDHLEKLIKVFEKLKISRTFFSVSLFLWIIEKNDGYKPTNNYELLTRFMTYILEGFALNNARAGSYNFSKKNELLTELALNMLQAGDKSNSYALKESVVIAAFQKNFDENQLRLKASEKVEEFIKRGLLKYDINTGTIQFRFESFFQYFISKNISNNPGFAASVVADGVFLRFIEEIDFHTGYKRTDKAMLERAVEELNKQFFDIDSSYDNKAIDSYFPKNSQLFKHIDAKRLFNNSKEMKLNDQQIEEVLGNQIDSLPVNDSIRIKESLSEREPFSSALEMVSRVLKNSENIKDRDLVNEVLGLIISKSAKLSVYIQSLLVKFIQDNPEAEDLPIATDSLKFFGPIFSQSMLCRWLGTEFIEVPLENKIRSYNKKLNPDGSELELFISAFLYADIQGRNYIDLIDFSLDNINNDFILELCYFKILNYYAMKSEKSTLVPKLEGLMAKIVVKVKGLSKNSAKQFVRMNLKEVKKEFGNNLL